LNYHILPVIYDGFNHHLLIVENCHILYVKYVNFNCHILINHIINIFLFELIRLVNIDYIEAFEQISLHIDYIEASEHTAHRFEAFETISHADMKGRRRHSLFNFWSSLFGSFCRILFVYGAHCFVRGRGAITPFILQFLKFVCYVRLRSSSSTPFYEGSCWF